MATVASGMHIDDSLDPVREVTIGQMRRQWVHLVILTVG